MPLQGFVQGGPPTINADWLNGVDVLFYTVFQEASTVNEALSALGAAAVGIAVFQSSTEGDAQDALGATTVGKALFTAASASAGRTTLGAGATGSSLFTSASQAAALAILGGTATGIAVLQAADQAAGRTALGITSPYDLLVACSDETTALVTTVGVLSFRSPRAFTLSSVKASLRTASSSGNVTVDVKLAGVSIFSTIITVEQGETTSLDATTQPVLSTTSIPADGLLTVDIVDDGTNAAGLKLSFIGVCP